MRELVWVRFYSGELFESVKPGFHTIAMIAGKIILSNCSDHMGIVNSAILAITTIVAITIAELIFLSNLIDSIDHMRETSFSE